MTEKRFNERLNEIYHLGCEMRKPGGDKFAESRYRVVVAELLLLVLDSLHALRTILCVLLGGALGVLITNLFL